MGQLNAPFTSILLSGIATRILLRPAPVVCAPLTRGSPPECSQKKKRRGWGWRDAYSLFSCLQQKENPASYTFPSPNLPRTGVVLFFTKWGENKS